MEHSEQQLYHHFLSRDIYAIFLLIKLGNCRYRLLCRIPKTLVGFYHHVVQKISHRKQHPIKFQLHLIDTIAIQYRYVSWVSVHPRYLQANFQQFHCFMSIYRIFLEVFLKTNEVDVLNLPSFVHSL